MRSAGTRLGERRRHARRVCVDLTAWAARTPGVHGLALVGSYARGGERVSSDVDVVVLLDDPDDPRGPAAGGWFERLRPGSALVRTRTWGPVREQRYRLRGGLVVEVGLAPTRWAAVPLDPGTRRVLGDGHRVLHDPHGALARAGAALRGGAVPAAEVASVEGR